MEWRWGRGRGGAHGGAASGMNRAMALSFWVEMARRCFGVLVAVRAEEGGGNAEWNGDSAGRRGVASRRGCDARVRTARGQRAQASGDGWRTRGVVFLKRSATAVLKIF